MKSLRSKNTFQFNFIKNFFIHLYHTNKRFFKKTYFNINFFKKKPKTYHRYTIIVQQHVNVIGKQAFRINQTTRNGHDTRVDLIDANRRLRRRLQRQTMSGGIALAVQFDGIFERRCPFEPVSFKLKK